MYNRFSINNLIFNCEYIRKYCLNNKCDENARLNKDCEQLLECAKFVDQIADDFTLEGIPSNGFFIFLRLLTSYTNEIVHQIKTKNRIDPKFISLLHVIFLYKDWLLKTYELLKNEMEPKRNVNSKVVNKSSQHLLSEKLDSSSRLIYDVIHIDNNILSSIFSTYSAFWLNNDIKKMLNFFQLIIALSCRLPFSLSALWSNKSKGRYCTRAFKNVSIDYPFNVWHTNEQWLIARVINFVMNRKIPVQSETLNIPKQSRFRLDYKGNILDFDKMTKKENESYLNDKEEQERQNAPGLRHRNKDMIRCRYSYITSSDKIKINREDKLSSFKVLKHRTARTPSDQCASSECNNNSIVTNGNLKHKLDNQNNFEINAQSEPLIDEVNKAEMIVVYIHGG